MDQFVFKELLSGLDIATAAAESRMDAGSIGMDRLSIHDSERMRISILVGEKPKNDCNGWLVFPCQAVNPMALMVLRGAIHHHEFQREAQGDSLFVMEEHITRNGALMKQGSAPLILSMTSEYVQQPSSFYYQKDSINTLTAVENAGPVMLAIIEFSPTPGKRCVFMPLDAGGPLIEQPGRIPTQPEAARIRDRCLALLD